MGKPGTKFKKGDKVLCVERPRHAGKTTAIKVGDKAILEKCRGEEKKDPLGVVLEPTHRWRVYRKGSVTKKTKKTYCYWEHDDECYVPIAGSTLEAQIRIESKILGGVK